MSKLKMVLERIAQTLSIMWIRLKEADYRAGLRDRHYDEIKNKARARYGGFYRGGGFN